MRLPRLRHPVVSYRRARIMPRWVRRLDRAANRRINASRSWHVHDRGYSRLSHAADRGLLWYAIAATLAVLGYRRAALRGVGSMVVSGVMADVVVKRFFDGRRPIFTEVPTIRRLRAYPTTPSFPSGHSASAAGFATGVALETPVAGAIIAPLAAAVAYSRLHVGAHWLSDVVGGVAIGAGVAALGRLMVPARARRAPAPEVEQVVEMIELPPLHDGAGVLVVMNKGAGTAVIRSDPRPTIAERLPGAVVRELEPDEAMADVVREIMSGDDPPRVLSVYGGDGSVSRMAQLAIEFDVPFMPLPGGTFNHFSRTAGIETVDLAIDALQAGSGIAASVGELTAGGRTTTVLNAASIGIYPEFVAERTKRKARLGKWIGGVVATWRGLQDAEPIDIVIAGRRARVWSVFVSVGRNTPGQVATFQRRTLSDDVLDVRVLHARGSRVQAVAALSFGSATRAVLRALRLLPPASDIEHMTATDLAIFVEPRPGEATFYAHDGELERRPAVGEDGRYTLTCRIVPQVLRVYAPAPSRERDVLNHAGH
ncbi:bifunctional phosphatase PAP2/diacylglycerol kinase family protein [Microbacterium sp.]|uniref:bifunctional phosphatase PAP2/diacylglycerol kinase family protein n=1 Tax=Microbacterium sp. TaxID=51671 RepID=UPI002E33B61C|nr:phosphatase PAP2 family protein [Microbacterium sp.]HEX5731171.1 phosphatase PAP2 family protein [Microbacterium sp.]